MAYFIRETGLKSMPEAAARKFANKIIVPESWMLSKVGMAELILLILKGEFIEKRME